MGAGGSAAKGSEERGAERTSSAARASQARASQERSSSDDAPHSAMASITKNCSAPIQVRKISRTSAAHVWRGCACRAALGLRRRLDLNDLLASVTLSHTVHSMHTSMSSVCDERLTLLTTTLLSRPGAEPPERSDIVHGDVAEALQPRDAAQQASCVLMFRSPPVGGAVVRSPSPHRVLVASLCVRDNNPHHHGRVLLLPSDPRYSSSLGAPFYARADAHRHHPNLHSDVRRALALSRLLSAL